MRRTKLTREFRVFGANVVISALKAAGRRPLGGRSAQQIEQLRLPDVVAAAPYLYLSAEAQAAGNSVAVIVAGTWFDEVTRMNSWWKVDGNWVTGRDNRSDCMIGEQAAARLGLIPGQSVKIHYAGREATLRVAAILTAGSSEDSQIFIGLPLAQELAGWGARASLIQITAAARRPKWKT